MTTSWADFNLFMQEQSGTAAHAVTPGLFGFFSGETLSNYTPRLLLSYEMSYGA